MNFKSLKTVLIVVIFSGSVFGQTQSQNNPSAAQVIDLIKKHVTCPWSAETVDTFKAGNPTDQVSGIAVCMFADMKALRQAVADHCNLIIVHEPAFYNHLDDTKTLENDPVFHDKIKYINDNKLIIWRFHDHIHRTEPDGIYMGMVEKLGWKHNQTDSSMTRFKFDPIKLSDFIARLKSQFPESAFRVVGNPGMMVTNVAFAAGAPGSSTHIKYLQEKKIDLLIAGEAPEWETYQYVYDAQLQGKNKAVILSDTQTPKRQEWNIVPNGLKGSFQKMSEFNTLKMVQFLQLTN